jgi:N-acetylglutamate synthase-like GNAT family acetyltransferase
VGSELRIREARESDNEQILNLMKASLGQGSIPRDREYWYWKHKDNPFGPSPVLIAEADDHVVGLRVFMRWTWEISGKKIRSVRAVDTATHPDWQGHGVFTRLTTALLEKMAAQGVAFVFNTPNDRSLPGYLKMGWSVVGRVPLLVCLHRPLRIIQARARGRHSSAAIPEMDGAETRKTNTVAELLEEQGLEELLRAAAEQDTLLSTPRRTDYFRWRYLDIPGFRYEAAWAMDTGVMIYRMLRRGELLELRICECLIKPGRASLLRSVPLIRRLLHDTNADYAVVMAISGTRARRALLMSTFLPSPRRGPILTVRSLAAGATGPDRAAWNLSIGDLELF